jgi:hypothetical protein
LVGALVLVGCVWVFAGGALAERGLVGGVLVLIEGVWAGGLLVGDWVV